jgi:hypothetical protein
MKTKELSKQTFISGDEEMIVARRFSTDLMSNEEIHEYAKRNGAEAYEILPLSLSVEGLKKTFEEYKKRIDPYLLEDRLKAMEVLRSFHLGQSVVALFREARDTDENNDKDNDKWRHFCGEIQQSHRGNYR